MLKKIALAVSLAMAATAATAGAIDFHGYVRTGVSGDSNGGTQHCQQVGWPAETKYRLGNECEHYTELSFGTKLYKGNNGEWANYNLRFAFSPTSSVDFETTNVDSRENFVQAGGFFGDGAFKDAKVWIGKRFYNRNDQHINDWYYWANTGMGAGIEDVNVDFAKFSYAFHQTGGYGQADVINRHEFRLHDIALWQDGKLETALELFQRSKETNAGAGAGNTNSGLLFTVQLQQNNLWGGYYKGALQYGKGQGGGPSSYAIYHTAGTTNSDAKVFRLLNQLMVAPAGTDFSGMATLNYVNQQNNPWNGGADHKWLSFGLRPVFALSENVSIAAEYGLDNLKVSGAPTKRLQKFTIAPQLQAGKGFWARPTFRLYATTFKGNYDLDNTAINGNPGKKSYFSYGAQVEAWW